MQPKSCNWQVRGLRYLPNMRGTGAADNTSPETEESRKILVEALRNLQNLEQLVNGTLATPSS